MSTFPTPLLPERHLNPDFFIPDIFDGIPVKDDIASMEHPMFSLSTKIDQRDLHYKNGSTEIVIKPTSAGLPTIFDKDVLLYCGSLLINKLNKSGEVPPRTLRISSHDLLVSTNRTIDKGGYDRLKKALERLSGVRIMTNIKVNKRLITRSFGLIDSWESLEKTNIKRRMVSLEITLSEWIYEALIGKEVLTINREYFRIRKPLERRLYEIARKHCGKQFSWSISLEKLKIKTGSSSSEKKFRFFIRKIEKDNHLPDYSISFDDTKDIITFFNKGYVERCSIAPDLLWQIDRETIERAKNIVNNAGTGWDFNAIYEQFLLFAEKKEAPINIKGAFIGFVKNKVRFKP